MTDDSKALEAAARAMLEAVKGEPVTADEWESMTVEEWRQANGFVQAAVRAYLAQREADGAVMVPVEPTEGMVQAMCAAIENADMVFIDEDVGPPYWAAHWQNEAQDAYRAMIAARPIVER